MPYKQKRNLAILLAMFLFLAPVLGVWAKSGGDGIAADSVAVTDPVPLFHVQDSSLYHGGAEQRLENELNCPESADPFGQFRNNIFYPNPYYRGPSLRFDQPHYSPVTSIWPGATRKNMTEPD